MYPYLCLQFLNLFKSFSSCQLTYGGTSLTTPRWKVVCLWLVKYVSVQGQEWRELSENLTLLLFQVGEVSVQTLTDLAVLLWAGSNRPHGSPCGLATLVGGVAMDTTACFMCLGIEIASGFLQFVQSVSLPSVPVAVLLSWPMPALDKSFPGLWWEVLFTYYLCGSFTAFTSVGLPASRLLLSIICSYLYCILKRSFKLFVLVTNISPIF